MSFPTAALLMLLISSASIAGASTVFQGYLRTGIGLANDGGKQACFKLPGAGAKYRLGNECGNYAELGMRHEFPVSQLQSTTQFKISYHGMLAFSSDGNQDGEQYAPAFRNNFIRVSNFLKDQKQASIWVGKRFYRRHDIHINDFFYWNTTGPGAGIEQYDLGFANISYGLLPNTDDDGNTSMTHDVRLSDIKVNHAGALTVGLAIGHVSNRESTVANDTGGWSINIVHKQKGLMGGDNTLAVQYGEAGLSNPGERNNPQANDDDATVRVINNIVFNNQTQWSSMWTLIYEDATVNNNSTSWLSIGGRPQYHISEHTSLAMEVGVDYVSPENQSSRKLYKITIAPQLSPTRDFWSRPVLRSFITYAVWNAAADTAGIDSDGVFNGHSGLTLGFQAEAWW